jgi:hypothetical protein
MIGMKKSDVHETSFTLSLPIKINAQTKMIFVFSFILIFGERRSLF